MKRELGIARCGLACCLCSENVTCKENVKNHKKGNLVSIYVSSVIAHFIATSQKLLVAIMILGLFISNAFKKKLALYIGSSVRVAPCISVSEMQEIKSVFE